MLLMFPQLFLTEGAEGHAGRARYYFAAMYFVYKISSECSAVALDSLGPGPCKPNCVLSQLR